MLMTIVTRLAEGRRFGPVRVTPGMFEIVVPVKVQRRFSLQGRTLTDVNLSATNALCTL